MYLKLFSRLVLVLEVFFRLLTHKDQPEQFQSICDQFSYFPSRQGNNVEISFKILRRPMNRAGADKHMQSHLISAILPNSTNFVWNRLTSAVRLPLLSSRKLKNPQICSDGEKGTSCSKREWNFRHSLLVRGRKMAGWASFLSNLRSDGFFPKGGGPDRS